MEILRECIFLKRKFLKKLKLIVWEVGGLLNLYYVICFYMVWYVWLFFGIKCELVIVSYESYNFYLY